MCLGLGDPLSAFSYATELLDLSKVPKEMEFLGRTYSMEALMMLNRLPEALKYLSPEFVSDISFTYYSSGLYLYRNTFALINIYMYLCCAGLLSMSYIIIMY